MKRRLTVLLVVLAACRTGGAPPGALTGASTPESSVDAFIAAGKAKDLQAMSAVWGTDKGPARAGLSGPELAALEKQELIIISLLCQDSARVVQKSPGVGGTQMLRVEMKRAAKSAAIMFTTVQGPSSRWYVSNLELEKLQPLCR